jgi:pilus assembly protein TadC
VLKKKLEHNLLKMNLVKKLDKEKKASANITRMVISMLIIFVFGYTPYVLIFLLNIVFKGYSFWKFYYDICLTFSLFMLFLGHSSYFIIYYKFNKTYRHTFCQMFHLN